MRFVIEKMHIVDMKLKANLHFHSREDPQDSVPYTLQEGIDEASRLHFDVLAIALRDEGMRMLAKRIRV